MAITFGDFLSIFTTHDASGGRAIKATFDNGVDDIQNYLTKNDPAGGRAIKIVNVGAPLGPQFWTEAYTATTQATSSWTAIGAATNINAAIVPKGNGAIVAAIPNGLASGGNARGTSSIDLQIDRNAANQVAGGSATFIIGGIRNRIVTTATRCSIFGGEDNVIAAGQWGNNILAGTRNQIVSGAGNDNAIAGGLDNIISTGVSSGFVAGSTNTVSGNRGTISGGISNTASGQFSAISGGQSNTASGSHSFVGGQSNTASGNHSTAIGQGSIASGPNSFAGGGGNSGGSYSFVFGSCQGNAEASIAIGRGCTANNPGQRGMIAMGNGCSTTYEGGVAMGANCSTSNFGAVALGQGNNATGLGTRATGKDSRAELQGQISHAGGLFTAQGDAQSHELIWRRAITGTAQTELFLDGTSIAAILPGTNSVWNGIIDIAAICTVTGDGTTVVGHVEATAYKVTIKRIGTTTSLVGAVQEIGITNADASMSTAVFTIDNNDTNESLRVRFTPPATAGSTTVIRAVATFRGTQIQY
jgi:hypothetical protein